MVRKSEIPSEPNDTVTDNFGRWFLLILALSFAAYAGMKYHHVTTALEAWKQQDASGEDARFMPPNR